MGTSQTTNNSTQSTPTQSKIVSDVEKKNEQLYQRAAKEALEQNKDQEWAAKRYAKLLTESLLDGIKKQDDKNAESLKLPGVKMNSSLSLPNTGVITTSTSNTNTVSANEIRLSSKSSSGIFQEITAKVSLNSHGDLSMQKKDFKGQLTDLSKDFEALFLGSDNLLRDKNGAAVKNINSATGILTSSYVPNLFNDRTKKDGEILSVKETYLNHFTHNGKQIVFVKGNPKDLLPVVAKDKEAIVQAKTEQSNDEKSATNQASRIPWTKYSYNELVNGCWKTKEAYIRKNQSDGHQAIEVFQGRDKSGQEIWVDVNKSPKPGFTVVNINKENGKMLRSDGSEIVDFSKVNGEKISAKFVKDIVDSSSANPRGIKSGHLNDLMIDGKRPIFL